MNKIPSCSLRSLIEQIDAREVVCHTSITDSAFNEIVPQARRVAESALCFNLGPVEGYDNLPMETRLFRLPFQSCWLEFTVQVDDSSSERRKFGIVAADEQTGETGLVIFQKLQVAWTFSGAAVLKRSPDGDKIVYQFASGDAKERLLPIVVLVGVFLTALNCCNVTRTEHRPDPALQRARAKRGKQPLFSCWTLDIDLGHEQTDRESMGGTHASPRLHLRRGHARQYAPGKYCWVQPHVVGNKAAGMVHKDYAVRSSPLIH